MTTRTTEPRVSPSQRGAGLFWIVALAALASYSSPSSAQQFTSLYSFHAQSGQYPLAGVIVDANGNIYGTTSQGGARGMGAVFKISASGVESVLHSFGGAPNDGSDPIAGLVRDAAGNLFGTTTRGGAFNDGAIFVIGPGGDEKILYSFGRTKTDGRYPSAGLLLDSQGNLFGTTQEGGTQGYGTVFELTARGHETILHSFAGYPTDGQYPIAGLTADAQGNLYGTTQIGGAFNAGTVFELQPNGAENVILSFDGADGGGYLLGGVVRDAAGNLYGTATYGSNQYGYVFELTPAGVETVLMSFNGSNGEFPSAGVIMGPDGTLYGTAEFGGSSGSGTVFSLTTAGSQSTLHNFGGSDGADPLAGLFMDSAGNLYGATTEGGAHGKGTVFKLTP